MRSKVFHLGIRSQFALMFILGGLLPISTLGVYSSLTAFKAVSFQLRSRAQSEAGRSAVFIDLYLQRVNNYLDTLAKDSVLVRLLSHGTPGVFDEAAVLDRIDLFSKMTSIPIRTILLLTDGRYVTNIHIEPWRLDLGVAEMRKSSWFLANSPLDSVTRFVGVLPSYIPRFENSHHFYFLRNVKDETNAIIGVLIVDMGSYLFDRLLAPISDDLHGKFLLVDADSRVIALSSEDHSGWTQVGGPGFESFLSPGAQVVTTDLITWKWRVVSIMNFARLGKDYNKILLLTFGLLIALLPLGILSIAYIRYSIIKPLRSLWNGMMDVRSGNLDVTFNITAKNEIGMLADGFKLMIAEIQSSMQKIKDEQRQLRKTELEALQAQMNPHFLYNSLNNIQWMSDLMGANNISNAIHRLVQLLRYSIGNPGDYATTVGKEIEYVRSYVYLSNLRFANKFKLEVLVDEGLEDFPFVKFLLQPLVENCIEHGLREKPGTGHIAVQVREVGENLSIEVRDDGLGFDFDAKGGPKEARRGSGVGLSNLRERLRLLFGDLAGLTLESKPGGGTIARLTLPADETRILP